MIFNLQALRFLAALAVVYYHTGYGVFGVSTEFGAVSVFFVISGFIMTMITRDSANRFFQKRLVRIVPLYWICTGLYWAMITLPGGRTQLFASLSDYGAIIKSLLFIPYANSAGHYQPILNVGWTLNFEMYFYLTFALCLMISQKWAPLLCSASVLILTFLAQLSPNDVAGFYGHEYVLNFVGGIAVYYLSVWIKPSKLLLPLSAVVIVAYPLQGFLLPHVMGFPEALVLSVIIAEKYRPVLKSKAVMLLGASSYAIYLSHFLVLHSYRHDAIHFGFPAFEGSLYAALAVTASSVALGIFLHLALELPVTRITRNWLSRTPRVVPSEQYH